MNKFLYEFINTDAGEENISNLYFLLPGVLAEVILTKKYYQKNIELKSFAAEVLKKEYLDYLFAARPAVYSRIVRDLIKLRDENKKEAFKVIKNIQKFVESFEVESNQSKLKKKTSDPIDEWRNIINPKIKGE
ncbi:MULTISPECIES: hypothetical protein [Listeria]|uniref:hypothetical protein n=1 Tax=Listeria TaxID=1637 RepID=UPI000B58B468|nr:MULTISPECIES: hypothetical protein [Listeria]